LERDFVSKGSRQKQDFSLETTYPFLGHDLLPKGLPHIDRFLRAWLAKPYSWLEQLP
jgi:hypothetical protein